MSNESKLSAKELLVQPRTLPTLHTKDGGELWHHNIVLTKKNNQNLYFFY
jgi:hypothetical protein